MGLESWLRACHGMVPRGRVPTREHVYSSTLVHVYEVLVCSASACIAKFRGARQPTSSMTAKCQRILCLNAQTQKRFGAKISGKAVHDAPFCHALHFHRSATVCSPTNPWHRSPWILLSYDCNRLGGNGVLLHALDAWNAYNFLTEHLQLCQTASICMLARLGAVWAMQRGN